MKNLTIDEIRGNNLLELARHHKHVCSGGDCRISLYWLLEDFEKYMGRKATKEEKELFI